MKAISAAEAAGILRTDHILLERRVRVGKLTPIQLGGDIVFNLLEVEAQARTERARDEAWSAAMDEVEQ